MKALTISILKVKLKGKNIEYFTSSISKILNEHEKIGFKQSFLNEQELNTLKKLIEKINK